MLPMQMKRILVVILLDSVIFFIPSLKLSPETEFCTGTFTLKGHGTACPYFVMDFVNTYFVRARSLCKGTARRAPTL